MNSLETGGCTYNEKKNREEKTVKLVLEILGGLSSFIYFGVKLNVSL